MAVEKYTVEDTTVTEPALPTIEGYRVLSWKPYTLGMKNIVVDAEVNYTYHKAYNAAFDTEHNFYHGYLLDGDFNSVSQGVTVDEYKNSGVTFANGLATVKAGTYGSYLSVNSNASVGEKLQVKFGIDSASVSTVQVRFAWIEGGTWKEENTQTKTISISASAAEYSCALTVPEACANADDGKVFVKLFNNSGTVAYEYLQITNAECVHYKMQQVAPDGQPELWVFMMSFLPGDVCQTCTHDYHYSPSVQFVGDDDEDHVFNRDGVCSHCGRYFANKDITK